LGITDALGFGGGGLGPSSLCSFSSFAFWLVIPAEAGIQLFDVVVVLTVAL
jgi:hypothetical protein